MTPQPSKDMNTKLDEILSDLLNRKLDPKDITITPQQYAKARIRQTLNDCLPEKKATAAPRGKMMSFNESCVNDGYNQAIKDIKQNLINKLGE